MEVTAYLRNQKRKRVEIKWKDTKVKKTEEGKITEVQMGRDFLKKPKKGRNVRIKVDTSSKRAKKFTPILIFVINFLTAGSKGNTTENQRAATS